MSRWQHFKSKLGVEKREKERSGSPVSPSPVLESFPSGIKVLFEPLDATVDIVFVHGLTGDRERTWTSPVNGVCWPRDLLPTVLPDARVLTFGYDAYVARKHGQIAQIDISHHANDLLNALANERQQYASSNRPILFVVHSLGGLLCKDAIQISDISGDKHLTAIASCTQGVLFIGTPHGGSWLATWAKIPITVMDFVTRTDLTLLSLLQPSSEVLCRIHDGFLSMIRRRESEHTPIEIACFYETLPMLGRTQIVDQPSATIPGFNNISIHADHRDIARFSTMKQPGYQSIVGVLQRWARPSETDIGLSLEAELFLETLSFSEMGVRQAVIEPAESGTCLWISEHLAYKAWVDCQDLHNSHGLLWIKGKPGSGKSTLLKHMASASPKPKGVVRLVFFFNARGAEEERNAQGLFKTFLHQLVHESPVMRRRLLARFQRKKSETGRRTIVWAPGELREMFFDALQFYSKTPVEIFVDALDECKDDEVRTIISAFETCAANYISKGSQNLKICWSSRHYPHISIGHGYEIKVEAMNLDDIELYVHRHLTRSERGEELRSLGSEIVVKSQGVFLWSVLVVSKICKLADRGFPLMKIEQVVRDLPSELSKLYAEIFSTLDPDLAEDTASLMYLTLYANRPLDTDELRLGIEFMRNEYPRSLQQFASLSEQVSYFRLFITELSGGLLELVDTGVRVGQPTPDLEEVLGVKDGMNHLNVRGWQSQRQKIAGVQHYSTPALHKLVLLNSNSTRKQPLETSAETKWIVQVIHETVRDFIAKDGMLCLPGDTSPYSMDPSTGHLRLYQMCNRIIATEEMSCIVQKTRCSELFDSIPDLVELSSQWLGTSIVEYVMRNIFLHLQSSELFEPVKQNGPKWELISSDLRRQVAQGAITEAILRWICIREGISRSEALTRRQHNPGITFLDFEQIETQIEHVKRSLHLSLPNVYECAYDMHLCLLTLHRKSFHFQGRELSVAISAVAHHGTEDEVQCLLSQLAPGAEMETIGFDSPLLLAVAGMREPVVDMLLAKGARVNYCTSYLKSDYTPLNLAVKQGDTRVVRKLLEHGADPNLSFQHKRSNLIIAASAGYVDIVKILLHSGADVLATKFNRGLAVSETAYDIVDRVGNYRIARLLKGPTLTAKRQLIDRGKSQ